MGADMSRRRTGKRLQTSLTYSGMYGHRHRKLSSPAIETAFTTRSRCSAGLGSIAGGAAHQRQRHIQAG